MDAQDMIGTMISSVLLSILHALIPNHWLPVLAISRSNDWSIGKTTRITFISGFAHVLSTLLIGLVIGLSGKELSSSISGFTHLITPILLIGLGVFFIYRHHHHNHFQVRSSQISSSNESKLILALSTAMFFSPCMEIQGLFLMAGAHGWTYLAPMALLYGTITILGMVICVRLAYRHVLKWNWHLLEHNAGIITGCTLILTGLLSFFIH